MVTQKVNSKTYSNKTKDDLIADDFDFYFGANEAVDSAFGKLIDDRL